MRSCIAFAALFLAAIAEPGIASALRTIFEIDTGADFDGADVTDVDGDGKLDIVSGGDGGHVEWYRHGQSKRGWTKHVIWANADSSIGEIEGIAAGDFTNEGQISVVAADQENGAVTLFRHGGDPTATWTKIVIQPNRPWLQSVIALDVDDDGIPEVVYAWEGTAQGSGGVHWLKFAGTEPTNPVHWTDHVMTVHEGAWGLRVPRFVQIGGGSVLFFNARNTVSRNPAAQHGMYYLTRPKDPARTWAKTGIGQAGGHTLNFDVGDFFGDGTGLDIAAGDFSGNSLHLFRASENWAHATIALAGIDEIWNVKALPGPDERDCLLVTAVRDDKDSMLYMLDPVDGEYVPSLAAYLGYRHPMDDRMILVDLDGDGGEELVVPDSGGDRLLWMEFNEPPRPR